MNITLKSVEKAPLPEEKQQIFYWDDKLKGFGLRVSNKGKKTYILKYRTGRHTRRMTLGSASFLTPDQARKLAVENLGKVAAGNDPAKEKQSSKQSNLTLKNFAEDYYENHVKKYNTHSTIKKYRSYLDRYLINDFGHLNPNEIDRKTIRNILTKAEGKDSEKRTNFNRFRTVLSKMFNYGIAESWVDANPVLSIQPYKLSPRDIWAKRNEFKKIYEAIQNEENPVISSFFKLLIFTACRKDEVRLMKWDQVDFKNEIWTIPETKSGNSHEIFLNKSAINTLLELKSINNNNPYVIIGKKKNLPFNGEGKAWRRIRSKANLDHFRIHDIRRTIASYLAQEGVPENQIAQVLNHKGKSVTSIYARLGDDTKRKNFKLIHKIVTDILNT